jgi:site-specific recombinase XerD
MTNEEVVARFDREYIQYHRISKERAAQQRRLLLEFGASHDLTATTADQIQHQAGAWLEGGYHVNTVRKKLNMLRPFFSWAYAVKLITAEQYMDIRLVKDPRGSSAAGKPRPYTRMEVIAFWNELDAKLPLNPARGHRSQAIKRFLAGKGPWRNLWRHAMRLQVDCAVRLALDLGLRRHEIFGLKVDDLHYENEYIVVWGKADPHTGEKKVRQVPFTNEARDAIRLWLEFRAHVLKPDHDSPWCSCWGSETYNHPMWERRFNTLLQDVIGPTWTWHRFRHTCATNWLRAGADLEVVQRLLGHATLQQTLAYAEILKSDVAAKLGRVEVDFAALSGPEVADAA